MSSSDTENTTDDVEAEVPEADELREELVGRLSEYVEGAVVEHHILPGVDLWVRVTRESWVEVAKALRIPMDARYFGFISAIDWLPSPFGRSMDSDVDRIVHGAEDKEAPEQATGVAGGDTRFQVLARVANIKDGWGITLKADLDDDDPSIASWTKVYAGADWHEREAFEMFGINFVGHPALRKIYLPTGFEGNPMRKDFPLAARLVRPWPGIVDVEPLPEVESADDGDAATDEDAAS